MSARRARAGPHRLWRDRAQLRAARRTRTAPSCARWSRRTATGTARSGPPKAALAGGATWLAVATAGEAEDLRRHGMAASDPGDGRAHAWRSCASRSRADADVVAWTDVVRGASGCTSSSTPAWAGSAPRTASEAVRLARAGGRPDDPLRHRGRARRRPLRRAARALRASSSRRGSATLPTCRARRQQRGHLRDPASHFDMVRCGIAIYGMDPFHEDPAEHGLEPALSLDSYVAAVRRFEPGDSAGYGRRWRAPSRPGWPRSRSATATAGGAGCPTTATC